MMSRPQRIRLLVAAHSGSRGGAEYCLATLLEHLDRERFSAEVWFAWEGPMVQQARQEGYPVAIWPWAWWMGYEPSFWHWSNTVVRSWWRVGRLVRWLRREKIDVVYTNTAVIFEPALAARWAGVPHVWHVHEILGPQSMRPHLLPWRWMVRWIGRWSQRVIFESDAARQVCQGLIPEEKMHTVYNAVRFDLDKMPAGATEAADTCRSVLRATDEPASRNTPETLCRVVWIGRLSPRKDPLLLLDAIARMKQAHLCQFFLMGEGPLEAQVRQRIAQLPLADRCHLLPFQEDVQAVLQEADLLLLTSREESFGLVLVEAGAMGLPVVATRTQGPSEIVVEGQTGLLVEVGDAAGLAAALDRLAGDPALRRRLGQAGAQRVRQLFHPVRYTRAIEHLLLEAAQAGKRFPGKRGSLGP